MTRGIKALLAAVAALLLALGAAACGSDKKSSDSGTSTGGSASGQVIKKNSANASKTLTIGTKNFPEQYILGEIYKQALEAAGYKVKNKGSLGSEVVAYKALKQGEVQAYPEYTGTALTSFYKVKATAVPKDPEAAYNQVKQKAAAEKIAALPRTPFENTYRLGMTKKTAQANGNPTKISDLKDKAKNLSITGYPECRQRPDCLIGVEQTYGMKFKKFVAAGDPYPVLDKGSADVGFVFTTDAPLATDKYVVLDDDKKLFPPYNITLLMRQDALDKLGPDATKVVTQVQSQLTNENMRELNSRVVLDKKKPSVVAGEYLKEGGYVK
jgi:glycine betaine/choline ABC-type transport system substrate-binding protein